MTALEVGLLFKELLDSKMISAKEQEWALRHN